MNKEQFLRVNDVLIESEQIYRNVLSELSKDKEEVEKVLETQGAEYEIFTTGPINEITTYNFSYIKTSNLDADVKRLIKLLQPALNEMNMGFAKVKRARKEFDVCVKYDAYTDKAYNYVLSARNDLKLAVSRYKSLLQNIKKM